MRRWPALIAASALALGAGGCSLGDHDSGESESSGERKVETTRVQVIEDLGRRGGFDAAEIYKRLSPGVVTVISRFGDGPLASGDGDSGLGSGFVLDDEGHVATNAHVVTAGQPPRIRRAKEVFVEFGDGNRVAARIVGADPNSDVGLLKIDPAGLSLVPLELGSSSGLAVGSPVAAIGSPFGERQSLSVGVISAVDREIESLTAFRIGNAIQTDAAINQGNSGGPLLNARGRVIGINAQIKSRSGGGEGVGFAVPVDTVRRSLDQLRDDGTAEYAYVGITSQELYPQLARHLGLGSDRGALVVDVEDGGPADDAGIEPGDDKTDFQGQEDIPRGGDVVVAVDRRPVRGADDLGELVGLHKPGDKVRFELLRGRERRTATVTLVARPARAPQAPRREP